MKTCRHCNWRFWPRVEYPKRCRMCQRPWPLGEPPKQGIAVGVDHAPGYDTERLRKWSGMKPK